MICTFQNKFGKTKNPGFINQRVILYYFVTHKTFKGMLVPKKLQQPNAFINIKIEGK